MLKIGLRLFEILYFFFKSSKTRLATNVSKNIVKDWTLNPLKKVVTNMRKKY